LVTQTFLNPLLVAAKMTSFEAEKEGDAFSTPANCSLNIGYLLQATNDLLQGCVPLNVLTTYQHTEVF
jgi:hypothetical protein